MPNAVERRAAQARRRPWMKSQSNRVRDIGRPHAGRSAARKRWAALAA